MAHWNPYYNGSNHVYQEQNPQLYNHQTNYGVPFQQLGYNDYYIPNYDSTAPNYDTNSTDYNTSETNYNNGSEYNLSGVNFNPNPSDYNTSNRNTNRTNRNPSGVNRNSSGMNRNSIGTVYNTIEFNTSESNRNSSELNYNASSLNRKTSGHNKNASNRNTSGSGGSNYNSGYNPNSSGYNPNSSGYIPNSSGYIPNTSRYNTNASDYNSGTSYNPKVPDYNTKLPDYNTKVPDYNTKVPDYSTKVPDYNTNAPDYNMKVPDYSTNAPDYNTNAPEFNMTSLNYKPSGPNYNTTDLDTKSTNYKSSPPNYSTSEYNTNAQNYKPTPLDYNTPEFDTNATNYKSKSSEFNYSSNYKSSGNEPEFNPLNYKTNSSSYNKNKSSRNRIDETDSSQYDDPNAYVSNLTATATEFTPSTSWQKPIASQTFNSVNYKETKHSKKFVETVSEEKKSFSGRKDEGNFMRFTNRKYNEKYKSNDKFKNPSYKRNRDDLSQNSSENSSYNNLPRDYYGNKNNRYKNNGDSNYNRNYQDKNERSGGDGYSDSYRNNSKYTYRSSYKDDNKYENWRSNTPSIPLKDKPNDSSQSKKNEKIDYQDRFKSLRDRKFYKDKKLEVFVDDDISQRDRLMEQVNKGTLECLVCCEIIRHTDKTWSCSKCYHIFHLRCSLKWAKASRDDNGWRCPACQHVATELPNNYTCYCGQVQDPVYRPGDTAHSCGNVCGRIGVKPDCTHKCRLLCHPGPCPTCENLVSKVCNCGATKQMVKCSSNIPLVCKSVCNKILNCGVHKCQKICHTKECSNCEETIHQECFCGKLSRTIDCTKDQVDIKNYSCEKICEKSLLCGNHKCNEICHPGDCPPCERSVDVVKTCPCNKTELKTKRSSCLDPIPCCDKVCGKEYICGLPSNPHRCKNVCHEGVCLVCNLTSLVQCRCGHMSCEIPCSELVSKADDARCKKKCSKKRSCAKHKCNQYCCIDIEHTCPLPCNRMLSCGQHRCELTCHKGRCPPCWRTSFEELYCECGASVLYPPVMCGTKRPNCTRPCSRQHECTHDVLHTCHSLPECPPCTVFTVKWCHGGHEKRSTIPCHQKDFSCGLPCNKDLPCGRHKCILPCHSGACLREGQTCTQSCTISRETCGHPCGLPCHEPPCQESPCKEVVKVTCECGLRSTQRACVDMAGDYQRITNSMLASKMADMQLGHSIDIIDIIGTTRKQVLKTLECNNDCKLIERNRRLAIGLQIRNPDLSAKLTPKYSDFMKQWAKKNPTFVQMVHDKLSELVQLAKQSKQKSRSYSFESMNRDKRHFIHEYCEHFGCESAAYDKEPNRNVVATAVGDKAWLPSLSVLELLQRECGQRKVPGPILNRPLNSSSSSNNSQSVSLKISSAKVSSITATFSSTVQQRPKTPEGETIDYFDYNPTK